MRTKLCKFASSKIHVAALLCIYASSYTFAQPVPAEITITAEPPVRVSGFEGVSPQELPIHITTFGQAKLKDVGAQRISDALRLDASVSDSYNLPAYWDKLSVRGFALDNRYNYRREGLPISAETIIPMDNKQRIELLKGTSGIQSGTSTPGGLVNYVVKRAPTQADASIRTVTLTYGPGNNRLAGADLGDRFGQEAEFGYRFNVAHEDLDPYIKETKGSRDLVALTMDWRIDSKSQLEWEFEKSRHEQIGVNFYSLLGSSPYVLPAPVDGTRNITRQPNSQPGVFEALTGSVRFKHKLDSGWLWTSQYGSQRLRADDRLMYASGCVTYGDSFCSNGDFKIREFVSENEHRTNEAVQTELVGVVPLAGLEHHLKFSVMRQRLRHQMPMSYSDNLVGTSNSISGGLTPPNAADSRPNFNTNINDVNTEVAMNDRVHLTPNTAAWLGLRHTHLNRQSALTNGNQAVHDTRDISTPWAALSYQLNRQTVIYASYGQGLEVQSAPNTSQYANKGQALPALRSTQREVGLKSQRESTMWQMAWFDISRPTTSDAGNTCSPTVASSCTRQIDGQAHHQGLELNAQTKRNQWLWGGSGMWIDAKREDSTVNAALNEQRPINVPKYILRGTMEYNFTNIKGLRSGLRVSHEGPRNVTDTGSITLPAWTTLDATTHYDTKLNNPSSTWTLAVNNVTNKHYWRESPKSYGQYFLYPGAPRTVRATIQFYL